MAASVSTSSPQTLAWDDLRERDRRERRRLQSLA
jgi:hypothetical protein